MSNIFVASDHHFGHKNILTFKNNDDSYLRVFDSVEEMDETMVMRHNITVKPEDKTYFLGDVAMHKKYLPILARMNGTKVLIAGNHDGEGGDKYLTYFKDIRGSHQFDGIMLSHIPIHPESLGRWNCNVHGHLHSNRVRNADKTIDKRYFCVSMEHIDYTPLEWGHMKSLIKLQQEQ